MAAEDRQHDGSPLAALAAAGRLETYELVAQGDPGAWAFAFDPSTRRGRQPPSELENTFRFVAPVASVSDLFGGDHADIIDAAWTRAVLTGGDRVRLPARADATSDRWWTVFDLRAKFDCMLYVEGSQPAEEVGQPVMPRIGRMRVDASGVILEADSTAAALMGREIDDIVSRSSLDFVHVDDHELGITQWIRMLERPGSSRRTTLRFRRTNDELFWVEVTNHNRLHDLGYIEREILDVSDRVDAELEVSARDRILQGITDVLPNGIAYFDGWRQLVFANDRWREITGLDDQSHLADYVPLVSEPAVEELDAAARTALGAGEPFATEITIKPADVSAARRCQLAIQRLFDDHDNPLGFVVSLDDITTNWRLQQRLVDQATRDQLTGLPNRSALLDHLDEVLRASQPAKVTTATIFLDLDDLKRVNDVLGHAAGDRLLQEISQQLLRSVRPGDLVARHGGDEFIVVCEDVADPTAAMEIARRVVSGVIGRYRIEGTVIDITTSCGVSVDTDHAHTAEQMIAEADLAMYERKRQHSHEPGLFAVAMFEAERDQLDRDSALRSAAEDGSLELHLQPIVGLATGHTVGYEALLRWRFGGALLLPGQFIGQAERRGIIGRLGDWVIDEVCRIASATVDKTAVWSLNVSPLQLRDEAFAARLASTLDHHGVAPQQIALELTEGVLMTGGEDTLAVMHELRDLGVALVVDDFGTGYASIDYLRTYPVSGVKIDRCFTNDIGSQRTQLIVKSVISLAEALDLSLVVEGIETTKQADVVRSTGAMLGQGYLFGRPEPWPG